MLMNILAGIVFLLMFMVLVSVHELGHYLFARLFNMGVTEFSVGMGRPIIKTWARRKYKTDEGEEQETLFNFRAWPIGGFVKILGMEPDEEGNEVKVNGGFYSKSPWQRIVVLLAGPVFSVVFGWMVLVGVITFTGMQKDSNVVYDVSKDMPAALAGIVKGDRILSIDGHPVANRYDGVQWIRKSEGAPLDFEVQRGEKVFHATIKPILSNEEIPTLDKDGMIVGDYKKQVQVGVLFGYDQVNPGFFGAMGLAAQMPVKQVQMMIERFTQPQVLINNSTGVVGMAVITKEAVQSGMSTVFEITGLISISLGIFNLIPIGPLDGGQIFLSLIEIVRRGKRVSMQLQMKFFIAGIALMLCLFIFRSYKDMVQFVIPGKENLISGTGKPPAKSAPATNSPAADNSAANTPEATNK